jgi:D-inositol-3-phosphate glycosyltransferase
MMGKANILIVSHYFPPHTGGIEFVAANQAQRLAAQGHSVHVLTSSVSSFEASGIVDGVDITRVKAWNGLEAKGIPFPLFSPLIAVRAFQLVRRADIIQIHDAFYISSFWASLAAWILRRPVVVTQHVDLVPHGRKLPVVVQKLVYATTGKFVLRTASHVTTMNGRVADFVRGLGVHSDRVSLVPNGVDELLFKPVSNNKKIELRKKYGLSEDKAIALFVGRYVHKKGFDKVINAASSNVQIVCAGGTTSRVSNESVRYLGILTQDQLAEVYQLADMFVLPSEGEGFPLSVQEAMASALPIIVAADRGYNSYGFDPQLLLQLENPSVPTIKMTLEQLAQNTDKRSAMSKYSRQYVTEHFSWSHVIAQLETIYDQLLASRSTR